MPKPSPTSVPSPATKTAPSSTTPLSTMPKSKSLSQSSGEESKHVALKGFPGLLRAAWIMLIVWIILLAALALHVLGVW